MNLCKTALCGIMIVTASCDNLSSDEEPVVYGYEVVRTYYHDPAAFTQGLAFEDGALYEGTGQRGKSSLRKVKLENGAVQRIVNLDSQYFGEGIALYDNRIVQLTWTSNKAFVYAKDTFKQIEEFEFPYEGWGLTFDGQSLIASDGSETLRFFDPETFTATKAINVHDDTGPVPKLNELEFIKGEIYANVWGTDRIVRIDPETGQVLSSIDLHGLLKPQERTRQTDVLNGIAYDKKNKRLFVTGKNWPKLFEIKLVPKK